MATVPDGTYNIINNASGRYANLAQGLVAPYTPVIAWASSGSGGENEKWVITFDSASGTYTIRSKLDANAYASVAIHIKGGAVANATRSERYTINQVTGGYRINLGLNAWGHANSTDADGIQIKLLPNGTSNDVWTLTSV